MGISGSRIFLWEFFEGIFVSRNFLWEFLAPGIFYGNFRRQKYCCRNFLLREFFRENLRRQDFFWGGNLWLQKFLSG